MHFAPQCGGETIFSLSSRILKNFKSAKKAIISLCLIIVPCCILPHFPLLHIFIICSHCLMELLINCGCKQKQIYLVVFIRGVQNYFNKGLA
jgi:hypothetical protein